MSEEIICSDCKYFKRDIHFSAFSKCNHPNLYRKSKSIIDGSITHYKEYQLCSDVRESYRSERFCGPEAAWFEPREPLFKRIKEWIHNILNKEVGKKNG